MEHIELTDKQAAVALGLLRRTPYKMIAGELGIAESTVNDHIRALRRKFDVSSTQKLVERLLTTELVAMSTPQNGGQQKTWVETPIFFGEHSQQNDEFLLADVSCAISSTDFDWPSEPSVVPEELDGPDAVLPRLLAVAKTIVWILAALVLTIAALNGVNSLVLDASTASEQD